jgi:uroporphyrinogen-III synthase
VDVVAFTSGSAVKELAREVGTWPPEVRIAAIGPVTAEAVREAGLPEALVPPQSTLPALAEIIAREGRPLE